MLLTKGVWYDFGHNIIPYSKLIFAEAFGCGQSQSKRRDDGCLEVAAKCPRVGAWKIATGFWCILYYKYDKA